jgi:hypothetical protein
VNEITDAASALATMKAEIERLRQQLDQKDAVGPTLQASEEMQQLQVGLGRSQAGGEKEAEETGTGQWAGEEGLRNDLMCIG